MNIFYSWQSDLPNKTNRGFIKSALEKAIKQLNKELDIDEPDRQLNFDQDTKNVPGMPDIVNTILAKISSCTVFVADVTFVGVCAQDSKKLLPNANVLIELGYALKALGSDKIICVMDSSRGAPGNLPFDLQHKRFPIQYDSTNLSAEKSKLVSALKDALLPIIEIEKYKSSSTTNSEDNSYDKIIKLILGSDSKSDWNGVSSGEKSIMYFKPNVHIRFEMNYQDNGVHLSGFKEPWANKHPDPNATSYWCDLYFDSTLIERFILVSVDGGRAMLPLPISRTDLRVGLLRFKVAQIHDSIDTLSDYMRRSNLQLDLENNDIY
jgi:hypothetical protein